MSTRATYRIWERSDENEIHVQTFYIHHDGYPEGCAMYLKELCENFNKVHENWDKTDFRPGKAITAFGMIVGVEYTLDHWHHGDTEYWYNIYCKGIDPMKWEIEIVSNPELSGRKSISRFIEENK